MRGEDLAGPEGWPAQPGPAVHMAGIGGVGMAGLALLLKARGCAVTGCDAYEGPLLPWLREQGISCAVGHDAAHLTSHPPAVLVRSPAVHHDEPELLEAARLGIPVLDRGGVLPRMVSGYRTAAVAGTHGKTTTASLLTWMLMCGGLRTSFIIGGVCPPLGGVARIEEDGAMVLEADESDGTLQYYHPDVAVITNMDLDHVDFFCDAAAQQAVYRRFAGQAKRVVWPYDDAGAGKSLTGLATEENSFGLAPQAGVRAERIEADAQETTFDLCLGSAPPVRVTLGVPGLHNVLNALAAVAAAQSWNLPMAAVTDALATFRLPRRRFELVLEKNGVRVFSDYAHHPAEIDALIRQARLLGAARVTGIFQPHRYSRTKAFKKAFAASLSALDRVVIVPVYAASEKPLDGGTSEDIVAQFTAELRAHVTLCDSLTAAWALVREETRAGDVLLVIGAGDVEKIALLAVEAWAAS